MSGHTRRSFLKASAATASVIGLRPVAGLAQTRRMDELIDEDATGLAERLRAREFTQAELVETFIRRIEVMNPALNFMTNSAFDRARSKADTIPLDAPFAGVPILMKDMIDIGGLPRTDGSRFMLKNVPERSVEYVEAVEAAGFNILGQTNVPEMASFIITNNDVFGATKKPVEPGLFRFLFQWRIGCRGCGGGCSDGARNRRCRVQSASAFRDRHFRHEAKSTADAVR